MAKGARPPALQEQLIRIQSNKRDGSVEIELVMDDEWVVYYRVIAQSGTLIVSEYRVFPKRPRSGRAVGEWNHDDAALPRGGITTDIIRRIRTSAALAEVHRWLFNNPDRTRVGFPSPLPEEYAPSFVSVRRQALTKPGRRGRDDSFYAEVAALYVEAIEHGKRPRSYIAKKLHLSVDRSRELIRLARQKGMLTRPTRIGVEGGMLTPKAERELTKLGRGRE